MAAYDRREFAGAAKKTTLAADINAAALAFTVADGTGYPTGAAGEFIMTIDRGSAGEERVLCSARAANAFTVVAGGRGYDGTAATAHSAGVDVEHTSGKQDFDEANKAVSETIKRVTAKGDLLGGTGANALERIPVGTDGMPLIGDAASSAGWKAGALGAAAFGAGSVALAKLAADVLDLLSTVGDIKWQAHDTLPSARWQVADGTAISRAGFAALFGLIGTAYGAGDGATTFNKPNLVDALPLGVANNAGRAQKAAGLSHPHVKSGGVSAANAAHAHGAGSAGEPQEHTHGVNGSTGAETNPGGMNHIHGDTAYGAGQWSGAADHNLAHGHDIGFNTGGRSAQHSHAITVNADNANHAHGDTIAIAAGTAGSVTKLVPMIRVS